MLKWRKKIYELVVPKENRNSNSVLYWRERIFYSILLSSVVVGSIVLIPSIITCVEDGLYIQVAVDIFVLVALLGSLLSTVVSYKFKTIIFLSLLYVLGVSLVVTKGPDGSGFIYLLAFSILASAWRGIPFGVITIVLNVTAILTIALLSYYQVFFITGFVGYSSSRWIALCANFVAINTVMTLSMGLLLDGLERTVTRISVLKNKLSGEKKKLVVAKQKAEEADRLKTAFLANMSHELKTPLTTINGFSNLIVDEKLGDLDLIYKYQSSIAESGDMLLNLINDILDISVIESGKLKIEKRQVLLKDIISEVSNTFDDVVLEKLNKNIRFSIEDKINDDNLKLYTDPVRLKQVINNLVKNAIKFTKEGFVKLSCEPGTNNDLQFKVSDTGSGIPHEMKHAIFKRFSRLEKHEGKIKGTGLGLAISKEIVETLGGKIWVDSEVGKGSVFSFTIKLD